MIESGDSSHKARLILRTMAAAMSTNITLNALSKFGLTFH